MMESGGTWGKRRTLFWLWLMIGAGCLLVFHSYLFGNETLVFGDVGSDTREQYIMQYNTVIRHLRSGNFSLWDFANGFGANMYVINWMEPFLVPVYLLGALFGPEHLTWYMAGFLILEILAAGTTCYWYLSQYPFAERCKLPAAFLYAFNGYLVVWGQHYHLGSVVVWLPLLLLFLERQRTDRRAFFGVALLSALLILTSFYQGYMCMLGVGLYVCFRELLFEGGAWKKKAGRLLAAASAMALGVLLGAVNLLPAAAAQLGATGRADSGLSLWRKLANNLALWDGEYYRTLLYRLFGSNLQGGPGSYRGYQNYYEAANVFFSTLFVVLLLQYVFTIHRQKTRASQKAAQYFGVFLAAFSVLVKAGSLAFNGFVYAFARHTFLLMPFFALLVAAMLRQICDEHLVSIPGLALGAVAIAAVYAQAFRNAESAAGKVDALLLCGTGLFLEAALLWEARRPLRGSCRRRLPDRLCCALFAAALFGNVISDTALCFRHRDTLKKDDRSYYLGTYHSEVGGGTRLD